MQAPQGMPPVILVADFELDSGDIKPNQGILGGERPGRLGILRGGGGVLNRGDDPADKARKLVDLLSTSLTEKLQEKGLPARRLGPGERLPAAGWVIQGQFFEVDEGNRLRRAVIGFGGRGNGHATRCLGDRSCRGPQRAVPLLRHPGRGSGKMPGAVVTMNPYVAAAKFVMAKNASEKDVKHTAGQIATEIVNYMKAQGMINP